MRDYRELNISGTKKAVREDITQEILEFLQSKYDVAVKVESNVIAIYAGIGKDPDGFEVDVPALIKVSCPSFYDKEPTSANGRTIVKYDVEEEARVYEDTVKAKAAKKKSKKTKETPAAE
jgi:hypothetical protein